MSNVDKYIARLERAEQEADYFPRDDYSDLVGVTLTDDELEPDYCSARDVLGVVNF